MGYWFITCALVLYIQNTSLIDSLSCPDTAGSVASVGGAGESWFGEDKEINHEDEDEDE